MWRGTGGHRSAGALAARLYAILEGLSAAAHHRPVVPAACRLALIVWRGPGQSLTFGRSSAATTARIRMACRRRASTDLLAEGPVVSSEQIGAPDARRRRISRGDISGSLKT